MAPEPFGQRGGAQWLRIDRDDPRSESKEDFGAVSDIGTDIEGQFPRPDEVAVERHPVPAGPPSPGREPFLGCLGVGEKLSLSNEFLEAAPGGKTRHAGTIGLEGG
jgi:hypothetical protein